VSTLGRVELLMWQYIYKEDFKGIFNLTIYHSYVENEKKTPEAVIKKSEKVIGQPTDEVNEIYNQIIYYFTLNMLQEKKTQLKWAKQTVKKLKSTVKIFQIKQLSLSKSENNAKEFSEKLIEKCLKDCYVYTLIELDQYNRISELSNSDEKINEIEKHLKKFISTQKEKEETLRLNLRHVLKEDSRLKENIAENKKRFKSNNRKNKKRTQDSLEKKVNEQDKQETSKQKNEHIPKKSIKGKINQKYTNLRGAVSSLTNF
jgi:hypothetical protein